MRRVLLTLFATALLGALALVALPAFGANVAVGNSGAPGDCSGNFDYQPASTSIAPGDTVTFTNPNVHNNGCASADHPTQCIGSQSNGSCPWQTEDLPPGGQFTVSFPAEGTFKYRCVAHPYMTGTITVGDGDPSEPSPEPTSEPEPTTPPPSSEPEPEPTSEPSQAPSPTAAATNTPSPSEEPTAEPSAEATDDASDEPTEPTTTDDPTDEPSDDPSDEPTDEPSVEAGEVNVDPPGSSGTGVKVLATAMVLGTAGALFGVRRGF